MNALTFDSLRIAMGEADARVRIEEEIPESIPQVIGIRMSGGFLDGQIIHFSPNLNCIIGGRGTGKSTTFEAIRCLSGMADEPASVVDSDVWPDQVDLLVQDQAGQLHAISRAKAGDLQNAEDLFADPETFPIECYRQGETHEISQRAQTDPAALLQYLDRFIEVEEDLQVEEGLRNRLLELQTKIEEANNEVDRIPKFTRDLASVKAQITAVEKAKGKDVIAIQRVVAQEKAIRDAILAQANTINAGASRADLKTSIEAIKKAATPDTLRVGTAEYATITQLATTFEKDLAASDTTLKASAQTLHAGIQTQLTTWRVKANQTAQLVDAKKKVLEAQGIKVDVAYFNKLATDEAKLTKGLNDLNAWKPHRTKLITERNKCLKDRWECRNRIAMRRAAFATKANSALKGTLSDLTVTLRYERSAYSPEADQIMIEAMGWRTNQQVRAPALSQKLTVQLLLAAIDKKDAAPMLALRDDDNKAVFAPTEANTLISQLGEPAVRYKLERCDIVDLPKLSVTRSFKAPGGKAVILTRQFRQLSLGQQQSVLLALMLSADSKSPLIIDQPEDNLDSEFIYKSIVPVLRRAKERRQVIVVTHNANVAVLGDAEQVIALRTNADKSVIVARGSIDDDATRNAASTILEGSREAFKRRARIYGFKIEEVGPDDTRTQGLPVFDAMENPEC